MNTLNLLLPEHERSEHAGRAVVGWSRTMSTGVTGVPVVHHPVIHDFA